MRPNVTPWRRGNALPVFLVTIPTLALADKEPGVRQLCPIAELSPEGRAAGAARRGARAGASAAARRAGPAARRGARARIPRRDSRALPRPAAPAGVSWKKRTLVFNIEVADRAERQGLLVRRWSFPDGWKRLGQITFSEAVASYNGDFVLHFHHAPWRNEVNNPASLARPRRSP